VATTPGKRAISDPDLRDRLYELLEHDHLPHSVGSRFVRLIIAIIVVDVLAAILASVPEYDAKLHRLFTAIEVAAVMAFAQGHARADEVTVSGFTTGTFNGPPQLSFVGNNFTGTTFLGVGSLSGSNNLGTIFLSTGPEHTLTAGFTLNVTFTSPTGIYSGQGPTYFAAISGTVSPDINHGGVYIDFQNDTPQVFNFTNPSGEGFFSMIVPDVP